MSSLYLSSPRLPLVCYECRHGVLTRVQYIGSRSKGRRELYTPLPLLRPLLPRRCHRWTDARLGRVLRRAIPRLLNERVSRPAGVDRPHKGAPLQPRISTHLTHARAHTAPVVLWSASESTGDRAQAPQKGRRSITERICSQRWWRLIWRA